MKRSMRFASSQDGATSTEYAIILAVLIILSFVGFEFLSSSSHVAFDTIDKTVFHDSGATSNSAESDHQTAAKHSVVEVQQGHAVTWWMAWLLGIGSAWIGARILWGPKKAAPEDDDEEVELIAEEEIPEGDASRGKKRIFAKRQGLLRALRNNVDTFFGGSIHVRRLMTTKITTIVPKTTAQEVEMIMEEKHIRHVLVCDTRGELLGIISDRDILFKHEGKTAQEIMTANPVTIDADACLNPTITVMIQNRISCLPVMDDGKLCGLFTTTDVMLALQCSLNLLHSEAISTESKTTLDIPSDGSSHSAAAIKTSDTTSEATATPV